MNTLNPYVKQYKKNQIETATPEQILILLYDAAINFLNKAKIALSENNDENYQKNISNCKDIILEFMNTLDMEAGGNVARTLYSLYRYYLRILTKTIITKDVSGIDEVLKHLSNLRETWLKAIEISNAEKEAKLMDKYVPSSTDAEEEDDDNYEDEEYDDEDEELHEDD